MLNVPEIPVEALCEAAKRSDVVGAVESLYAELERRIAERAPTCWNKGECCRFGRYGHRLYVTALEVAYYLARIPEAPQRPVARLPLLADQTCPHAFDGKCQARVQRPLGCRVFYCDTAAQAWQGPLTEEYLARLRALHEQLGVPYFYADWLTVLSALRAGGVTFPESD